MKALNIPVGEAVALYNHALGVNIIYTRRKPQKYTALITTEHHGFSYVEKKKTEAHMFYNGSKGGVDTFNQMCSATNCARKTDRWPQCVFYNLVNIIMNNMYICHSSQGPGRVDRHTFNRELAIALARPHADWRLNVRGRSLQAHSYIRFNIELIFQMHRNEPARPAPASPPAGDIPPVAADAPPPPRVIRDVQRVQTLRQIAAEGGVTHDAYPDFIGGRKKALKRKRCPWGPRSTWSGFLLCAKCQSAMCNNHSAVVCPKCYPYDDPEDPQAN